MKKLAFVTILLAGAAVCQDQVVQPQQNMPPAPWQTGCFYVDTSWPFLHFVDCPEPPPPAPTPPLDSNPKSCQDCIAQ